MIEEPDSVGTNSKCHKNRIFIVDKAVSDLDKKEFYEQLKNQNKKGRGSPRKNWDKPNFERKCK